MLRDELRRHGWDDVSREGWKQVKGGQEACDDVVGKPPGSEKMIAFENKFYATGFDKYYALLDGNEVVTCITNDGDSVIVSLNPNKVISVDCVVPIESHTPKDRKALLSLIGKCRKWIGKAQILSLKQNGLPFLYCRYRK
jgi:hypothetical protein